MSNSSIAGAVAATSRGDFNPKRVALFFCILALLSFLTPLLAVVITVLGY